MQALVGRAQPERGPPARLRRHYFQRARRAGLVYVALIMDDWSRRVARYAIGSRINVQLTPAALHAAIVWIGPAD